MLKDVTKKLIPLLFVIPSFAHAIPSLMWNAPPSRVDGEPLGEIIYLIYWSDNDVGYKLYTEPVTKTQITLGKNTPNNTECVYMKVSVFEESTGLESDMSDSVKYCPDNHYVKEIAHPMPVDSLRIVD